MALPAGLQSSRSRVVVFDDLKEIFEFGFDSFLGDRDGSLCYDRVRRVLGAIFEIWDGPSMRRRGAPQSILLPQGCQDRNFLEGFLEFVSFLLNRISYEDFVSVLFRLHSSLL